MEIEKIKDGVYKIKGDLNIYIVKDFSDKLKKIFEENKILYIDLSEVTDIDTSCIQVILALLKSAKKHNKQVKLINLSDISKEAFELTGTMKAR